MVSSARNIRAAEKVIGVRFRDADLLASALTHSSMTHEGDTREHSERLEFLGDAVLGLVVTEHIYKRFPKLQEGDLAKMRANLVRAETLADLAADIGLGELVAMSKGTEQAGGRSNQSILSDCLEAVIGAVYLDQGLPVVTSLVLSLFTDEVIDQVASKPLADAKTTLQELTMAKWGVLPAYDIERRSGPAHKPLFEAYVKVKDRTLGQGMGSSKKRAEQLAAAEALAKLDEQGA